MKRVFIQKVRIKDGWCEAGKTGVQIGFPVMIGQLWTPVMWDDEEDPDWHKSAGLEVVQGSKVQNARKLTVHT